MKFIVFYCLSLMLPFACYAQKYVSDIVKIGYCKVFIGYSSSFELYMEVKANGAIRMYNDGYDTIARNKIYDLVETGSRSISAGEFVNMLSDTTIDPYYTGKLSSPEYQQLISLAKKVQEDTTKYQGCFSSHTPYEGLKIYYGNGTWRYILCDFKKHPTISPVMEKLNNIAYKRGYTRSAKRFDIYELF